MKEEELFTKKEYGSFVHFYLHKKLLNSFSISDKKALLKEKDLV